MRSTRSGWAVLLCVVSAHAFADERATASCARRLAIAFTGADVAPTGDPADARAFIDQLTATPAFAERFARFINSKLNATPGQNSGEDATYHFAKYVLENGLKWEDMFLGKLDLTDAGAVKVVTSPNGLGYFRSRAWRVRYAGNEEAGVRIVSAYRMMQNTVGLKLAAAPIPAGTDFSASGREAAGCRGCHYESWYALDKVAVVLGTVTRNSGVPSFKAYDGPAMPLLGKSIADDAQLIEALVHSQAFEVNACRLAAEFVFGRPENSCDGALFDRCITAFRSSGRMQDALATIGADASFCSGVSR